MSLEERVRSLVILVAKLGRLVIEQGEEINRLRFDIETGVQVSEVFRVELAADNARNLALAATGLATKAMGQDTVRNRGRDSDRPSCTRR